MWTDSVERDACEQVRGFVEAHRDQAVEMLAELVRVPSDNPPGDCQPHADRAAALLEKLGFEVERHPVPPELVRNAGMISATNLVVRHRFGSGPTIALNAHGDVVAPGEGWNFEPYGAQICDGWIYGRGATASKSDFATYAYALLALRALGRRLGGAVEIHLTYDEEVGGEIGPKRLLSQGITAPDFAICAGFTYVIINAHSGCLHLEVEVNGKSSHAARPELGHDAMEAANRVLSELFRQRQTLGRIVSQVPGITHPTLVVGLIRGGINTNVLPDRVVFRLDRRLIPEENGQQVTADLVRLVKDAVKALPGISCETRTIMLAEPLVPVAGQERLVGALKSHADRILGEFDPDDGRADLHGCAPLLRSRRSDRALRRWSAPAVGGQRPWPERAPETVRPDQGHGDRCHGLLRPADPRRIGCTSGKARRCGISAAPWPAGQGTAMPRPLPAAFPVLDGVAAAPGPRRGGPDRNGRPGPRTPHI